MRALVKQHNGVAVATLPIPAALPGTVVIAVAVSGICRTDLYVAQGVIKTRTPLVLGHEFSGTVTAVGAGVTTVTSGQRVGVMPLFAAANAPTIGAIDYASTSMLGVHDDGSFAEYVRVPAHAVYALPDTMTWKQGAYLEPVAASLAVANAQIAKTQRGLIYGDNRISRLTQRCLQARGFDDVSICDSQNVLPSNSYDFIVETLANTETMARIITALKPGGRLILKSRQHAAVSFNINQLVMKGITIEAVSYAPFQEGIDLIASGKLTIDDLFGDVYALDDYAAAFDADMKGESRKIFLSANSDVRDL